MLSDFPIMLRGFTYYAQILNIKCTFETKKYTDKCWSITDDGLTRHFFKELSSRDPLLGLGEIFTPSVSNCQFFLIH